MRKDAQLRLTPKLRFPEFRKGAGWEETILGKVLTEHGEKNDGSSEVHSVSVHKGVINQIEHLGRSFAAADRSNYNLAKPHDIIYTKSPTGDFPWGVVKQNRLPYNVIVSPLYGVFSPVNRHLGYILDSYFESPTRTTNYLAPITQKGAKNTIQISNTTFLSKGLYLPSTEAEHKKIASLLFSLDELIRAESRKLDALKAHKKGLMQQLFPSEGKTVPRIRFPEFGDAPEWDIELLECVAENLDSKRVPVTEKDREEGKIPYYGASGVVDHVREYLFDEDLLCVSEDGANLVARTYPIAFSITGKTWVNNHAHVLRFEDVAKQNLVENYLNSIDLTNYITGMAQPKLNKAMLNSIPIPLPEPPEQTRIASCLTALDGLIAAQTERVAALKTHKKGLMQQLFPSTEGSL